MIDLPRVVVEDGCFEPDVPLPQPDVLRQSTKAAADAQEALARLDVTLVNSPHLPTAVELATGIEIRASAAFDGVFATSREVSAASTFSPGAFDERLRPYFQVHKLAACALGNGGAVTPDLVDELAAVLAGPRAGESPWRRGDRWLGGPDPLDAVMLVAPPGPRRRESLRDLCLWALEDHGLSIVAKVAVTHLVLAITSPFQHSTHLERFLPNLMLIHSGMLRHPVLPLSQWLRRHHRQYLMAVRRTVLHGDLDFWISFLANGIRTSCVEEIKRINALNAYLGDLLATYEQKSAAGRMIEALVRHPRLRIKEAAELCGVTQSYANSVVRRMQRNGHVREINPATLEDAEETSYGKAIEAPRLTRLLKFHNLGLDTD